MIKKISFILILFCMIISCGKKGDPQYQDPEQKAQIQSFFIHKI